jgi:hypothetical protein
MTDRELLELAAKAAGVPIIPHPNGPEFGTLINGSAGWNPLTNDGDALRLAVKLRIDLEWDDGYIEAYQRNDTFVHYCAAEGGDDIEAAARRAIVRAAAEIGRSMK